MGIESDNSSTRREPLIKIQKYKHSRNKVPTRSTPGQQQQQQQQQEQEQEQDQQHRGKFGIKMTWLIAPMAL